MICWTKFAQRVFLVWIRKKWTPLNFAYSKYTRYKITAETDNFDFWDQICTKRLFLVKYRKSEHYHWILDIRISPGTKFQLKQTINILDQIYPKRMFPVLNRKSEYHHEVLHIRISLQSFAKNIGKIGQVKRKL